MVRYLIALLVFLIGFVSTVFLSGGDILSFIDIPTLFSVGLSHSCLHPYYSDFGR